MGSPRWSGPSRSSLQRLSSGWVASRREVFKQDNAIAHVRTVVEERERQKTGLVCLDCTDENDTIAWGPDAED